MSDPTPPVTYDESLIRQTGGKLYFIGEDGKLQQAGNWAFQFTVEDSNTLDILVTMNGDNSMAAAMGVPLLSTGKLSKESANELKVWLGDILQKMNQTTTIHPITKQS